MRVLLIDDDPLIAKTLRLGWPDKADTIEACRTFEQAKPIILSSRLKTFDCVILDLHLPDATGAEVLAEIRRNSDLPIVMLSGTGDADFRAELLITGADDYVMKPVGLRELHARVQKLVRRTSVAASLPSARSRVRIGDVTYYPLTRRLAGADQSAELTHAEAGLLDAMILASGEVVHRDDLYLRAFARAYRDGEKVLETYIGRLRQKLSDLGEDGGTRLLTVRGLGYRLVYDQITGEDQPLAAGRDPE